MTSSSSSAAPYPVILCGATEAIAKGVIAGLKPEYEVIHLLLSPAIATATLPHLLTPPYQPPPPPPPPTADLATANYARPAMAVILGGAYTDEDIAAMRVAVEQRWAERGVEVKDQDESKALEESTRPQDVPWLRPDLTIPTPPLGPAYGRVMVERVKRVLEGLVGGKGEGEGKESRGVVYY